MATSSPVCTLVPAYISPKDPLPIFGPTRNLRATLNSIKITKFNQFYEEREIFKMSEAYNFK